MTSRQFEAWVAWDKEQMNYPNRADHYSMLVAMMIAKSNSKHPSSVSLDSMKIRFKDDTEPVTTQDREMRIKTAKAAVLSRLGTDKIRLPDGTFITKKEILEMPVVMPEDRPERDSFSQE